MHNIAMTRIWIVPEKFPKSDVQGSVVDQILDVDVKFFLIPNDKSKICSFSLLIKICDITKKI